MRGRVVRVAESVRVSVSRKVFTFRCRGKCSRFGVAFFGRSSFASDGREDGMGHLEKEGQVPDGNRDRRRERPGAKLEQVGGILLCRWPPDVGLFLLTVVRLYLLTLTILTQRKELGT